MKVEDVEGADGRPEPGGLHLGAGLDRLAEVPGGAVRLDQLVDGADGRPDPNGLHLGRDLDRLAPSVVPTLDG